MGELKSSGKSFDISKWEVHDAWEKVKANKGAAGVDGCCIEDFEKDLKNNLYKVWNRMSSGSYFPPPVLAVEIPKPHGDGVRVLGVPTVADRVAQTVVAARLEREVEPIFHSDSYGYRRGRSALDAVGACRARCWKYDWVIDLDIQKFFDTVSWDLIVKAVAAHTDQPWVLLYVKRWLHAPLQQADGTLTARDRGTPQGSAVSPVLANLFLHYAFDAWMAREFPTVPFERYVDDAVVHCVSEQQARDGAGRDRRPDGAGRVASASRQDPDRLLPGRATARLARAHVVHVLGVRVPAASGAEQARAAVQRVLARDQQARPEEDQCRGAVLATAPPHRSHLRRPRTVDQSDRAGLDAVLRGVLPLRAVSTPLAHQRLPGALDPQEIQTTTSREKSHRVLAGDRRTVSPHVRALDMDSLGLVRLVTRRTRAR